MNLGEKIKAARLERHMTQKWQCHTLGQDAGIPCRGAGVAGRLFYDGFQRR